MTEPSIPLGTNGRGSRAEGEISLVEVVNTLLRHRRLIILLPFILAVLFATHTLLQDRTYVASASFIPQASEGRSSGMAGMARQFGFSLGTERTGHSPEFYVDLLRSRALLKQAVEAEYEVPDVAGGVRTASLIELYEVDESSSRPGWRQAVARLQDDVSASVGRETGMVKLRVAAFHPALAEQIAARMLELLNQFNLETRQSQAQEESRFVSDRMQEARVELLRTEEELKRFLQQNRQFTNSPELVFEHERLGRQVEMRQEVYTALAQSYERARIDAVRDTPVLTVVERPEGSADPQGRGLAFRTMLGFAVGVLAAVFLAFVFDFVRRARSDDGDEYREFDRLRAETVRDFRNPIRLVTARRSG